MMHQMPGDIFATGQILNNTYEILGVLGRGGTGEVYLARNQIVDRKVAIKALNSEFSGNDDYIDLMKREEEMRDIIHDAVVRYSECSRSDAGHVFLVMEFVDGISLNDLMQDRRLEDKELLIIAHRVLEGLVPVHAHGIVHRDLSPDNIILRGGAPERATIIDFGIAKDTSAGARTIVGNEFAGKYEYAAPEQLDGHAEFRTDLYALGASLLAAHKRDIPYLGSTPGEIIRRKQEPLDTSGVGAPLKDLIDWLAAPDIEARPRDAREALDKLDSHYLKTTETTRRERKEQHKKPKKRGVLVWLAVPGLAVIAAVGLWVSGVFVAPKPPPIAAPYLLSAGISAEGETHLRGHSPDPETTTAFEQSFAVITGKAVQNSQFEIATGMPSPDWPAHMQSLLRLTDQLEDWDLSVADMQATLKGLASDQATRDSLRGQIETWAATSGFAVQDNITAGPRVLATDTVQTALADISTCGPLSQSNAPPAGYVLGDTVAISGDIASPDDADLIEATLGPIIGDRTVRLDTVTLNEDLCAIRSVLPAANSANLSIWLGEGDGDEQILTGVYQTGQNPVIDINMPATITEGSLWVMIVDNTGKVFHVLPNVNRTGHDVAQLGAVENGVRRVRVLHSIEQFKQDTSRLAMRVNQGDYGKSEVIAVLSQKPLFDGRRPRDESVTSVAEALGAALEGGRDDIVGMASRIIDARP